MSDAPANQHRQLLLTALDRLQSAIELMDEGLAPGHIAALVDLAIHQLADALGIDAPAIEPIASNRKEGTTPLVG